MAGDWIKMRPSLLTSPKVNGMARLLEASKEVTRTLSNGFNGHMSEIVTRSVMRHVTVASLMLVWGAANDHTEDGVFKNADLSDVDDIAGIPGFGEAMESVGWAIYDAETNCVSLPNFNEYNTSSHARSAGAKSAAQRQKEYRDRKKSRESDVTRDLTNDVASNRRIEKRREEVNTPLPHSRGVTRFEDFWSAWPVNERKQDKVKCAKKWKAAGLDTVADAILADIAVKRQTQKWNDGYVEAPLVYLNGKRWEDGVTPGSSSDESSSLLAGAI